MAHIKEKLGRSLSYMLRHSTDPLYINLDGGWASVKDILSALNITRSTLDDIVESDSKNRYSYDYTGARIRANQGHSIPGVYISMDKPYPPEFLYHGTATRYLPAIMADGLYPVSRLFVHISTDIETATKVGSRHGNPVVLQIRAREFVDDGNELFLSANNVWQAKHIPPKYFNVIYS